MYFPHILPSYDDSRTPIQLNLCNLLRFVLTTTIIMTFQMSGSLKYLLQRVVTEKISLSASVTNSEADIESIKERLTTSLAEINGSHLSWDQLTSYRA